MDQIESLSPERFEALCLALLRELGFRNIEWRKGGRDRGRDLVADFLAREPDGHQRLEKWFVECKHHGSSNPVSVSDLQSKIAWADAEGPDCLLIATSGHLSVDAKDWLGVIARQKRYRVRYWEDHDFERLLTEFPHVREIYLTRRPETHPSLTRFKRQVAGLVAEAKGDSTIEIEDSLPACVILRVKATGAEQACCAQGRGNSNLLAH